MDSLFSNLSSSSLTGTPALTPAERHLSTWSVILRITQATYTYDNIYSGSRIRVVYIYIERKISIKLCKVEAESDKIDALWKFNGLFHVKGKNESFSRVTSIDDSSMQVSINEC